MRVGISFRIGPFRFYQPLNNGKKKRKPAKPRPQTYKHEGCWIEHVSMNTLTKCAIKKGLPVPGPEDARPDGHR